MSQLAFCILTTFAALGLQAPVQERFDLIAPGQPQLRSSAVLDGERLAIVDPQGQQFTYVRQPQLDTTDGTLWGFYCEPARRYLRWPAAGVGNMYLGSARGAVMEWTRSSMRVQRVGPVVANGEGVPLGLEQVFPQAGPMNLAVLPRRDGKTVVAQIDGEGQLRFYVSEGDGWRTRQAKLRERLPSGAPLALADDPRTDVPLVYTIDARGQLVEIEDGERLRSVTGVGEPRFPAASHLAILDFDSRPQGFAVDQRGRLWQLDLDEHRDLRLVESQPEFEPGGPIAVAAGPQDQLFAVNRAGRLLGYRRENAGWSRSYLIGEGFVSGGSLWAMRPQPAIATPSKVLLAAVDAEGRLRLLTGTGEGSADSLPERFPVPPGAPVAVISTASGLSVMAVTSEGQWFEWHRDVGDWRPRLIADGFPVGTPVYFDPAGGYVFAVDRTGRLIAARQIGPRWVCHVCSPRFAIAPQLVRRTMTPVQPLPPVRVEFENRHKEELVVRLVDVRDPQRPMELRIPPGKSLSQRLDRDAGAVWEESYLVLGPLGELAEEVVRYPLPPRLLYQAVVYTNRVTSVYFDRTKNKGPIPDKETKSLVSLGVFPLPPGDQLRDGDRLDVHAEAVNRRNPGAAALFGEPIQSNAGDGLP